MLWAIRCGETLFSAKVVQDASHLAVSELGTAVRVEMHDVSTLVVSEPLCVLDDAISRLVLRFQEVHSSISSGVICKSEEIPCSSE